MIVLVGKRDAVQGASVWSYDDDSNLLWTYDTGNSVERVVLDGNNNVYVVGMRADNGDGNGSRSLWKLDSDGNYLGGYDTTGNTNDIAIDSQGRIVVSGSGAKIACRIAANLGSHENVGANGIGQSIVVDSSDNILVGAGGTPLNLYKYNATSLALEWSKDPQTTKTCTGVKVLSNDDVVCIIDNDVYCYSADGNTDRWNYAIDTGGQGRIAIDSNDLIYICRCGDSSGLNKRIYCLNSNGVEQWTITTDEGDIEGIFINGSDIPYVCGDAVPSMNLFKVDIVNYQLGKVLGTSSQDTLYGVCGTSDVDLKAVWLFEYYTGSNGHIEIYGDNWRGQTFTPSADHMILQVDLKMFRLGSPGTLTVEIYDVDENGHPDIPGGILCSGTTDGDTLTENANGEWREITLGGGAQLDAGTQYAIVCHMGGDVGNNVRWRLQNPFGTYTDGDWEYSANGGSSWTTGLDKDCTFKEYGRELTLPTITDQSDDADIELGKIVNLFVTAEGVPSPTYQWYLDGIPISGEINSTLSFYAESSGIYRCKVSNVEGDIWSDPIVLTIIGNPYTNRLFSLFIDANRGD